MRPILKLLGACIASLMLYWTVFAFVLHAPLTLGEVSDLLTFKRDYAASLKEPKLVIFAGSNALFSHRCQTITRLLGVPCVNFGIARGVGFDYLVASLKPALHPGDVVYMPWEYDWYQDNKAQVMSGPDGAEMFYGGKRELIDLGLERSVRASFSFDLPFVFTAITEMGLDAAGVRRRFNLRTLTPEGDEMGHTAQKARAYASYVRTAAGDIPSATELSRPSYIKSLMIEFFAWARRHGVAVVGGLQTMPSDVSLSPSQLEVLRRFYESNGENFLVLENRSQYPRKCFYDTLAHLNEYCQIQHSTMLAAAMVPFLEANVAGAKLVQSLHQRPLARPSALHVVPLAWPGHASAPR